MNNREDISYATCPRCGERKLDATNLEHNALARRAVTSEGRPVLICSDCGTEEAFEDAGMLPIKKWNKEVR